MTKKDILPATPSLIIRPLQAVGLTLIGLVLAGCLAAFQVVFTPSSVYRDGESQVNQTTVD